MRLLETGKTATQREIYYMFVKHFANQVNNLRGYFMPTSPNEKAVLSWPSLASAGEGVGGMNKRWYCF